MLLSLITNPTLLVDFPLCEAVAVVHTDEQLLECSLVPGFTVEEDEASLPVG